MWVEMCEEKCLLIDCGMLLIMRGGWLDFFVDVEWNVVRLVEWHVRFHQTD